VGGAHDGGAPGGILDAKQSGCGHCHLDLAGGQGTRALARRIRSVFRFLYRFVARVRWGSLTPLSLTRNHAFGVRGFLPLPRARLAIVLPGSRAILRSCTEIQGPRQDGVASWETFLMTSLYQSERRGNAHVLSPARPAIVLAARLAQAAGGDRDGLELVRGGAWPPAWCRRCWSPWVVFRMTRPGNHSHALTAFPRFAKGRRAGRKIGARCGDARRLYSAVFSSVSPCLWAGARAGHSLDITAVRGWAGHG